MKILYKFHGIPTEFSWNFYRISIEISIELEMNLGKFRPSNI